MAKDVGRVVARNTSRAKEAWQGSRIGRMMASESGSIRVGLITGADAVEAVGKQVRRGANGLSRRELAFQKLEKAAQGSTSNSKIYINSNGEAISTFQAQKIPAMRGRSIDQIEDEISKFGFNDWYAGNGPGVRVYYNNIDSSIVRIDTIGNKVLSSGENRFRHGRFPHVHRQSWDTANAPSFNDMGVLDKSFRGTHTKINNPDFNFEQYYRNAGKDISNIR